MTVPLFDGVDWEVAGLFAVLVFVEGLRQVPAGALVVRAIWWSDWKPAGALEPRTRWRLVSWWSPLARAIVLPQLSGPSLLATDELLARLGVARRAAPWLAGGGALTLATLILGVPVASARLGTFGFLASAAIVLALTVTTVMIGVLTLRRLGPVGAGRRRLILGWCSPFACGRVLEGVYEIALAGAAPAQALRALVEDQVFADWARARAYDVVHGGATDPDLCTAVDVTTLHTIIATVPRLDPGGKSYCPRCGATWSLEQGACADCTIPLVRILRA